MVNFIWCISRSLISTATKSWERKRCAGGTQRVWFISPAVFVSIAEDIGLIKELGDYILENAIREFSQFSNEYVISDEFLLHINVSPGS